MTDFKPGELVEYTRIQDRLGLIYGQRYLIEAVWHSVLTVKTGPQSFVQEAKEWFRLAPPEQPAPDATPSKVEGDKDWIVDLSEANQNLRAELTAAQAEAQEAREKLNTVHTHVKESLELLGVDVSVNGYIPDSWTLREQCKLAADNSLPKPTARIRRSNGCTTSKRAGPCNNN